MRRRQRPQIALGHWKMSSSKDKVDNKDVKDEETTTTSDSSWPLEDVKLKDKVDKSLTSAISENIKQKLKKKLTSKIFSSGFPFH